MRSKRVSSGRPGEYGSAVLVFARYSRMDVPHFSLLRILADGRFHPGERLGRQARQLVEQRYHRGAAAAQFWHHFRRAFGMASTRAA